MKTPNSPKTLSRSSQFKIYHSLYTSVTLRRCMWGGNAGDYFSCKSLLRIERTIQLKGYSWTQMEHAAFWGTEGTGGVLSMASSPKWSILASDQIRNLSLFTRLTSWILRESVIWPSLTCTLVDFCLPSTKFNLLMNRQQCSYFSRTPSSFDRALLIARR